MSKSFSWLQSPGRVELEQVVNEVDEIVIAFPDKFLFRTYF